MCTKGDLNFCTPIVLVLATTGLMMSVLCLMFQSHFLYLVCCWLGLIFTCIYTVYDVYLITEKHGLSNDDYIIGAMLLYLDLIHLFIYILSIFGERR